MQHGFTSHIAALLGAALIPAAAASAKAVQADFNSDGYADLAIGNPAENFGAGAVHVIYGRDQSGLDAAHDDLWDMYQALRIDPTSDDGFGTSLAVADFNGDGYSDLAVGVPGYGGLDQDDFDGLVVVIYGSIAGLKIQNAQLFNRGTPGVKGNLSLTRTDGFGQVLAAGNFDGDGWDDLAISCRTIDIPPDLMQTPAIHILYGAELGLTADGDQYFKQKDIDEDLISDGGDFGNVMTVGDFDNDNRDDLALGAPATDRGHGEAGVVYVVEGSSSGLRVNNAKIFEQGLDGVDGAPAPGDRFGWALAAGDFDGNNRSDLAIGVTGDDGGPGAVQVLYGSIHGLRDNGQDTWTMDTGTIRGVGVPGDQFGYALAAGDFDRNGKDDLAIGTPLKAVDGVGGAGVVSVIYGTSSGLQDEGNQIWHQDRNGVKSAIWPSDFFGFGLTAGDYNQDGRDDLVIGVSGEDLSSKFPIPPNEGAVAVLYGKGGNGLSASGNQFWSLNSPNIEGFAGFQDFFGQVLR